MVQEIRTKSAKDKFKIIIILLKSMFHDTISTIDTLTFFQSNFVGYHDLNCQNFQYNVGDPLLGEETWSND